MNDGEMVTFHNCSETYISFQINVRYNTWNYKTIGKNLCSFIVGNVDVRGILKCRVTSSELRAVASVAIERSTKLIGWTHNKIHSKLTQLKYLKIEFLQHCINNKHFSSVSVTMLYIY